MPLLSDPVIHVENHGNIADVDYKIVLRLIDCRVIERFINQITLMRIASHRFAGLLFNLYLLPGPRFPKNDRNWRFCIFAPLLVKVRGFSLLDLGMLVFSKVDAQSRRPGCANGQKRTSVVIINSH